MSTCAREKKLAYSSFPITETCSLSSNENPLARDLKLFHKYHAPVTKHSVHSKVFSFSSLYRKLNSENLVKNDENRRDFQIFSRSCFSSMYINLRIVILPLCISVVTSFLLKKTVAQNRWIWKSCTSPKKAVFGQTGFRCNNGHFRRKWPFWPIFDNLELFFAKIFFGSVWRRF